MANNAPHTDIYHGLHAGSNTVGAGGAPGGGGGGDGVIDVLPPGQLFPRGGHDEQGPAGADGAQGNQGAVSPVWRAAADVAITALTTANEQNAGFGAERFDTDTLYDGVDDFFEAVHAGGYAAGAFFEWDDTAVGSRILKIKILRAIASPTEIHATDRVPATVDTTNLASAEFELLVGDRVFATLEQTSGGALSGAGYIWIEGGP